MSDSTTDGTAAPAGPAAGASAGGTAAARASTVVPLDQPPPEQLAFACPRCASPTSTRFYGPCPACVDQLRGSLGGDARDVAAPDYEPKMNVTPNAVATKD